MLLTIDVGNTNSVFAVFEGNTLKGQWRLATNANRTADEYAVWLRQLMQWEGYETDRIDAAILSTVVPHTQFELITCCRRYFHTEPLVVNAGNIRLNIDVDVDRPEEIGADRLVNAVEAWRRFQESMVLIDFGTATTFDVITEPGVYIGGVIAPGVYLSLTALQQAAAKLPSVRVREPAQVVGRHTVAAMESGIYYGYVGMIEGVVARIRAEHPGVQKVIATGGLAPLYARHVDAISETISDLTIYGLASLYAMNTNEHK